MESTPIPFFPPRCRLYHDPPTGTMNFPPFSACANSPPHDGGLIGSSCTDLLPFAAIPGNRIARKGDPHHRCQSQQLPLFHGSSVLSRVLFFPAISPPLIEGSIFSSPSSFLNHFIPAPELTNSTLRSPLNSLCTFFRGEFFCRSSLKRGRRKVRQTCRWTL